MHLLFSVAEVVSVVNSSRCLSKGGLVFTTVLLGLGLMNIVRLRHDAYGEPTQFVGCDKIFLMLSPM